MAFVRTPIHLTKGQLTKLRNASKAKRSTTIELNPKKKGNFHMYLTKQQRNKLNKSGPSRIKLSKSQLARNGGLVFTLPLALGIASAIGSLAGGGSAIAKTIQAKKAQKKLLQETQQHNKRVENLMQAAKKSGTGAFLPRISPRRTRRKRH